MYFNVQKFAHRFAHRIAHIKPDFI